MASGSVPERLTWAVRVLDPAPDDRVLEIGCGRGVAAGLIRARLTTGTVTGLDRSATAVEAARRRHPDGRDTFHAVALEAAEFPDDSFDRILAVNVNVFWVRSPDRELAALRRWLTPAGTLCLCWEPPDARRAEEIAGKVAPLVASHGFTTEVRAATAATGSSLVAVVARRPP
ncbi:class I SAM-dependent methyltransferase [Streptomyces bullii]|uniref:Class I SAM-dependent methyltransferase n=1 Tax=Streptomyces bullii TaxID=349910 RepID=A0ABW0UVS7_9ACTN